MEAEGGEGGGNSSDSGSGGIIDVSTVSSNFNAATPQTGGACSGEDKKSAGKRECPLSVDKVWFTDTSTGVWLLEEESGGCEIPDEFLDVSLESEEERDEVGEISNDEEEGGVKEDSDKLGNEADSNDAETVGEKLQLCGWVPPQCCLIPLPESAGASDDEREGEEGREPRGPLSNSELQRQHARELEVLFGVKPPPSCKEQESSVPEEGGGKEWSNGDTQGDVFDREDREKVVVVAGNVVKPRSNSTDSGVVSISPHSSDGDLEQGQIKNPTVVLATGKEQAQENNNPAPGKATVDVSLKPVGDGGMSSTPEKQFLKPHPPVSRLRTPSERLQKCSIFTGSPVVCSDLEDLKEASKMTIFPPAIPLSTSPTALQGTCEARYQTFTVTPPPPSSTSPPALHGSSSSSVSLHSEKSGGSQNISFSSAASSAASQECATQFNRKRVEKKVSSIKLGKSAVRGTFAYKAGSVALPVKVVKRPPLKLKSLLPASAVPSALPSQVKKPPETKRRGSNPDPQGKPEPTLSSASALPRKSSAPTTVRSSGLVPPGKKLARRSLDPTGALRNCTFAKPANPNSIKEVWSRPSSAANPTRGGLTTPIRNKGGAKSKSDASMPTRQRGNSKQPLPANFGPKPSTTTSTTGTGVSETVADGLRLSCNNKSAGLSTSIMSNCSPSVQQSTPMRRVSHSSAAAANADTIVKAVTTTVTKDSSSAAADTRNGEGNPAIPVTPRSSISSTPSRRVRPKFSLSSIDSESGPPHPPPAVLGSTFTEEPAVESTPKSQKMKRRSFIPTPARQESREVAPLVYTSDHVPTTGRRASHDSPVSRKQSADHHKPESNDMGAPSALPGKRRSLVPNPRQRRPLVSRNRLAAGLGRRLPQKAQDGPLKPMSVYKYSSKGHGENSEPPVPTAKMVHSPVNKDDQPNSPPHSAWSPIRRKPVAEGDACFQCTKRGYRN